MIEYPAFFTSVIGREMFGDLPMKIYEVSRTTMNYLQAAGDEMDLVAIAIESLLNNQFVEMADSWGLEEWERELGLPIAPTESEARRKEMIKAKLMGVGTCTIKVIKSVVLTYEATSAEVVENHPLYTVIIRFVGLLGIPARIASLQVALRELIPAHLVIEYEFVWTTWDAWDAWGYTWDASDALGLTWDGVDVHGGPP